MKLDGVVTGTGRSGTSYMVPLLSSAGLMCGHQRIFDCEGLSAVQEQFAGRLAVLTSDCSRNEVTLNPEQWWRPTDDWFVPELQRAESSDCAAPYHAIPELRETRIVPVVRNPRDVASSWVSHRSFLGEPPEFQQWIHFIAGHVPGFMDWPTTLDRTVDDYVRWNPLVESQDAGLPYLRVSVVHQPSEALASFLSMPKLLEVQVDRQLNSWGPKPHSVQSSDLPDGPLRGQFLQLVQRYGSSD